MVRAIPVACVAMVAIQIAAGPLGDAETQPGWRWTPPVGLDRTRILRELENAPGEHLVFVRYAPTHRPGDEWVYNSADIDGQRVVWARELDPESNARLIAHYPGRRVWLAEPEAAPARLTPYAEAPPRPMRFVPLGAPGIDVLSSPPRIAAAIRALVPEERLSCWQWNFAFTRATGVEGPEVNADCYGSSATNEVTLEHWLEWVERQR